MRKASCCSTSSMPKTEREGTSRFRTMLRFAGLTGPIVASMLLADCGRSPHPPTAKPIAPTVQHSTMAERNHVNSSEPESLWSVIYHNWMRTTASHESGPDVGTQITFGGTYWDDGISWAPDGRSLLFHRYEVDRSIMMKYSEDDPVGLLCEDSGLMNVEFLGIWRVGPDTRRAR